MCVTMSEATLSHLSTYNVAFPRVNDRIFMAFNHKRESQKRETDMITHTVRI